MCAQSVCVRAYYYITGWVPGCGAGPGEYSPVNKVLEGNNTVTYWFPCNTRVKSEVKSVTQLHDLPELPVYAQPKKLLTTPEAVFALLSSDLEKSSICTRAPFSVDINAAFIVDLNKFGTPKDVLCDDMGSWIWGGSNKRWISADSNGLLRSSNLKMKSLMQLAFVYGRGTTP